VLFETYEAEAGVRFSDDLCRLHSLRRCQGGKQEMRLQSHQVTGRLHKSKSAPSCPSQGPRLRSMLLWTSITTVNLSCVTPFTDGPMTRQHVESRYVFDDFRVLRVSIATMFWLSVTVRQQKCVVAHADNFRQGDRHEGRGWRADSQRQNPGRRRVTCRPVRCAHNAALPCDRISGHDNRTYLLHRMLPMWTGVHP
jgi:hypothetical protein